MQHLFEKWVEEYSLPLLKWARGKTGSPAAAEELTRLGYTRVYDIGGITDWPYEMVYG